MSVLLKQLKKMLSGAPFITVSSKSGPLRGDVRWDGKLKPTVHVWCLVTPFFPFPSRRGATLCLYAKHLRCSDLLRGLD